MRHGACLTSGKRAPPGAGEVALEVPFDFLLGEGEDRGLPARTALDTYSRDPRAWTNMSRVTLEALELDPTWRHRGPARPLTARSPCLHPPQRLRGDWLPEPGLGLRGDSLSSRLSGEDRGPATGLPGRHRRQWSRVPQLPASRYLTTGQAWTGGFPPSRQLREAEILLLLTGDPGTRGSERWHTLSKVTQHLSTGPGTGARVLGHEGPGPPCTRPCGRGVERGQGAQVARGARPPLRQRLGSQRTSQKSLR